MTFADHLNSARGSVIKARRTYLRERRWSAEDWYIAWQTTDLPREVAEACKEKDR